VRKAAVIVVSLGALTLTSEAQAHPKFLWHHKKMSAEQRVAYFQRSINRDRFAIRMLTHRRSLEGRSDLPWYRAALRWHTDLYERYKSKLVPKIDYWVAKQMRVAALIAQGSGGDPWPNCPDPYDGGGSWQNTVNCENGGNWYDSPGYYRCGLQFDPGWERKYGRLCP
jgi:hypothetical protein